MSIPLYMDVHVPLAITKGLRRRGVDVLTAQQDGAGQYADSPLLDRARELNRVIFSQDEDLIGEAVHRQRIGESFVGVIYAHQQGISVGQCIEDLELISQVCEPEEFSNRIEYLPLR